MYDEHQQRTIARELARAGGMGTSDGKGDGCGAEVRAACAKGCWTR